MTGAPVQYASRRPSVKARRVRYATRFVDGSVLEATLANDEVSPPPVEPMVRVIGRVDDTANEVRANVQDAARAVLTWLASMVGHAGQSDLDAALDRCLRPGPDVERVNYAALAAEVSRVTGVELTPKRVQTAVTHLRKARRQKHAATKATARPDRRLVLDGLEARLRDHFTALTDGDTDPSLRRDRGVEILSVVRSAAGRVIDRDFGEGIPETLDHRAMEGRFMRFVHRSLHDDDAIANDVNGDRNTVATDLRRLLVTLADRDVVGRAEADMKLVLHGARVVASLMGAESLPGVMAQLNVMVAGRDLIDTDLYVAEMLRLAGLAEALHEDAATASLMNYVRRLPEDQRLPSPIRVSSYCRSNAATRLYDRIHRRELDPHAPALADATGRFTILELAHATHDHMLARDGGFTLTLTTEFLRHLIDVRVTGETATLDAYLAQLGEAKALDRLESLIRFENNDALVAEARAHAVRVHPALEHQLICVA